MNVEDIAYAIINIKDKFRPIKYAYLNDMIESEINELMLFRNLSYEAATSIVYIALNELAKE